MLIYQRVYSDSYMELWNDTNMYVYIYAWNDNYKCNDNIYICNDNDTYILIIYGNIIMYIYIYTYIPI